MTLCGLKEFRASLRDVTLGMSFCCWLWAVMTLLSSFRVASDFQGFLQRFDCVGSMFKLGLDVKAASSFGVDPSFKESRDSSREQRERERGCPFLAGLTSGRPPALFQ